MNTVNTTINIAGDCNTCDECGSLYYAHTSAMASLCPQCAHFFYGYENCTHAFNGGRCVHCFWDGKTSAFCEK